MSVPCGDPAQGADSTASCRLRIKVEFALLRPSATGRIWFSIQLLSMGSCPLSRKRVSACQRRRL
jgi:hypothetical protein